MKTYLFSIPERLKNKSEELDVQAIICNKTWEVFNNDGTKQVFIFKPDGSLIISVNGLVTRSTWEYLATNKSLLITADNQTMMLHPAFTDDVLFVLQVDGTQECVFMINGDNKELFPDRTLKSLNDYFAEKAKKISEEEAKALMLELKRLQEEEERLREEEERLKEEEEESRREEEEKKARIERREELAELAKKKEMEDRKKKIEERRKEIQDRNKMSHNINRIIGLYDEYRKLHGYDRYKALKIIGILLLVSFFIPFFLPISNLTKLIMIVPIFVVLIVILCFYSEKTSELDKLIEQDVKKQINQSEDKEALLEALEYMKKSGYNY